MTCINASVNYDADTHAGTPGVTNQAYSKHYKRSIENPVEPLCKISWRLSAINCFCKKLHYRCLNWFRMRL